MLEQDNQLALSAGLAVKTQQLGLGLESGAVDILELVTPTTAGLLLWWFGEGMMLARPGRNAIVAHEVLGQGHDHWTLLDLYQACAPDALLTGTRMVDVERANMVTPNTASRCPPARARPG